MRVLIAEDDETSHRILQAVLTGWGYEVLPARSGAQAWDLLAGDTGVRMGIFDWMMPEMDGLELIGKVRGNADLASMYVILLTARERREDIVAGLDAGADDYVTKPFDREELRARVRVGERVVELQTTLEGRVGELENALSQIKTLRGLIPMCAGCHKIHDDKGYWQHVESYVMEHSDASFSHGLCPECVNQYYPEYEQIKRKKDLANSRTDGGESEET